MKHKYAVYGNEETTPLQVAKENNLKLDECILCLNGKLEAEDCWLCDNELIIIGPGCYLCDGITNDLSEHEKHTAQWTKKFKICHYCNHSDMIYYHNDYAQLDTVKIFLHINNMFNLFERRMKGE